MSWKQHKYALFSFSVLLVARQPRSNEEEEVLLAVWLDVEVGP
jgi:hypothetical protein